jgi:hypothetical protein
MCAWSYVPQVFQMCWPTSEAKVKYSKWRLQLNNEEPWLRSFILRKSWWKAHTPEYHFNLKTVLPCDTFLEWMSLLSDILNNVYVDLGIRRGCWTYPLTERYEMLVWSLALSNNIVYISRSHDISNKGDFDYSLTTTV